MQAGDLDRRIALHRQVQSGTDGMNQLVYTWQEIASRWARKRDVSDGEKYASNQVAGVLMSRFVVRKDSVTRAVAVTDRISYDGATWEIFGIKDLDDGRDRFIEITAIRDPDDGQN
ncbi:head-tail adaptor protein [Rhizobium deserti]|uniref:Head-tail adaptor protein n=1 Tax=Rhizobium deserti TaxID=2547961 RepID=A0A4R5UH81_9HYPH|nr:phage head closure protein [Rhizobium deserti]TDK35202.1 head-tail adaptor protein [Rhizobium deserti]